MAEALARRLSPADLEIWSAGSEPTVVNPLAVQALAELGIDIAGATAKRVEDVPAGRVRRVITLCAQEVCPVFPAHVDKLHWPFEDPAAAVGSEADRLASFVRVRDQIAARLDDYFAPVRL